eukprot:2521525-Rhodomonas_salina.8
MADSNASRCPVLERGFVFYWSLAFILLYPVGIPAGMMAVLHWFDVPGIARRKQEVPHIPTSP